jgi:hypothetical protein
MRTSGLKARSIDGLPFPNFQRMRSGFQPSLPSGQQATDLFLRHSVIAQERHLPDRSFILLSLDRPGLTGVRPFVRANGYVSFRSRQPRP